KHRARPGPEQDVTKGTVVRVLLGDVGNLHGLAGQRHAALDAFTFADRRLPGKSDHLLVEVVGGAKMEDLRCLVVLEDGARVGPGQLAGSSHNSLQHSVEFEGRAQSTTHVCQGLQLIY